MGAVEALWWSLRHISGCKRQFPNCYLSYKRQEQYNCSQIGQTPYVPSAPLVLILSLSKHAAEEYGWNIAIKIRISQHPCLNWSCLHSIWYDACTEGARRKGGWARGGWGRGVKDIWMPPLLRNSPWTYAYTHFQDLKKWTYPLWQDGVVAKQYLTDQQAFQRQARQWTRESITHNHLLSHCYRNFRIAYPQGCLRQDLFLRSRSKFLRLCASSLFRSAWQIQRSVHAF